MEKSSETSTRAAASTSKRTARLLVIFPQRASALKTGRISRDGSKSTRRNRKPRRISQTYYLPSQHTVFPSGASRCFLPLSLRREGACTVEEFDIGADSVLKLSS